MNFFKKLLGKKYRKEAKYPKKRKPVRDYTYAEFIDLMSIIERHPDQFTKGTGEWLKSNMPMWCEFRDMSLKMAKVRDHYSARRIIEYLRVDTDINDRTSTFKVNNNSSTQVLSRLFILYLPENKGFYETRRSSKREKLT